MNWHIITSSKGGVGKTLISLMLLNSSRQTCEPNSHVLVIDLNGMNADLRRMVASPGSHPENQLNLRDLGFYFEAVLARNYIVGWPMNSFKILTPENFFDLVLKMNDQIKGEIQKKFGGVISTVIIDTSYHYCNLFPETLFPDDNEQKPEIFNFFAQESEEKLFIWFIWVYRQLSNLTDFFGRERSSPYHVDAREVQDVGVHLEGILGRIPFVHVFSPNSVGQVSDKLMSQIFGDGNPLRKLASLKKVAPIRFVDFIDYIKKAEKTVGPRQKKRQDAQDFFIDLLHKYVDIVGNGEGCPQNVIPVLFDEGLLGYTELKDIDMLKSIDKLEVYKSFSKAYQALV